MEIRRMLFIVPIIITFILVSLSMKADADEFESLKRCCIEKLNAGNHQEGLPCCEKAIAKAPEKDAELFRYMGGGLRLAKKYKEAIRWYDDAIKLEPGNGDLYALRGITKFTDEKGKGAGDITKAVELNPNSFSVNIAAALFYTNMHDIEKAFSFSKKALDLAKTPSEEMNAGRLYEKSFALSADKKQSSPQKIVKDVKTLLTKMFELARTGKNQKLAEYILYMGKDQARRGKNVVNYANADDKIQTDSVARIIKGYLDQYPSHEFTEFMVQIKDDGEWYAWEVTFKKDGKTEKAIFGFLKLKDRYLLGDID
ncbi:hypothetical protein QUF80_05360 [Desulfococcaceae bacterium HSG8]|nr:hypothetical protein [Desulfococcaceae bacterium HSG8]